jgi:hypothetical protein
MDWKCDVVSFDLILETSVASTITGLNKYVEGFNIWVETLNIANITSIEPEINLLKLDIEGAEYSVLKNLSSYYFKKINQIFLEFHGSPVELNSILKKEGYHTEYRESIETDTCGFIYAKRV